MYTKDKIEKVVIEVIEEIFREDETEDLQSITIDTPLYGKSGNVDSMTLVRIVAEVEDRINTEFSRSITLADEKAMSQKISPFRNARALTEYIWTLLNDH